MKKNIITALLVILAVALITVISLNTKNEKYGKTGDVLRGNSYAQSSKDGKAVPSSLQWGDPASGMFDNIENK